MNDRIVSRLDSIDGRLDSVDGRLTRLETSHSQFREEASGWQAQNNRRFDDLYTMGNDNHRYLQDVHGITTQLADFHVQNEQMPHVALFDHQQRIDWRYPFEFPPPGPRPSYEDL